MTAPPLRQPLLDDVPVAAGAEVRRPTDLGEARAAVRTGGTLLLAGAGTKLGWGNPPEAVDAVVTSAGLDRLLDHNAGDATARVQAGVPLVALQDALAAAGQRLAVDPVGGENATVGGIFATDDAGPGRLAFGTMRDLVIGATVVLADGAVARSGGQVIKNVAGYDLARVLCGSYGTLGFVAELNLRLHPLAQRTATVRAPADPGRAMDIAESVRQAGLEPVALELADDNVWIRLEGRAGALAERLAAARRIAGGDADVIDADSTDWSRLVRALHGEPGESVVRIGALPRALVDVHDAVATAARDAGVQVVLTSAVLVGSSTARVSGGGPAGHGRFVEVLRARLAEFRPVPGHAVVRRRGDTLAGVDAWGSPGSSIGLARAVKQAFDPQRRLAPGRFLGGI